MSSMAQDIHYTDSLKQALNKLPAEKKINLLWLVAREYAFVDSTQTRELAQEIKKTEAPNALKQTMNVALEANLLEAAGQKEKAITQYLQAIQGFDAAGYDRHHAQLTLDLGVLYGKTGEYEKFKTSSRTAIASFSAAGDSLGLIAAYSNLGRCYQLMGQFDSAIVHLYRSAEIAEAFRPTQLLATTHLRYSGNTYNNLGIAYMENGDLANAMRFYEKATQKKKELNDPVEVGNMYINIGGVMFGQNKLKTARSYLDSAAFFYRKENHQTGVLLCETNAAAVSNVVQEYDKTLTHAREGIRIARQLSDRSNLTLNYIHIGTAYGRQNKPLLADAYLDSAMQVAKAVNSKNLIAEVTNVRYELALAGKDFEKALHLRNEYYTVKDSMYQVQKSKEIAELETQYKTTEKEREIVLLNKDNELKEASLQRNGLLIAGLVIFIVLMAVVFYFWRYRARQQHLAVLHEQKIRMREHQMQAVIDSQERERKRFATDLHDGMGQLIAALQLNIQSMNDLNGDLNKRDELYQNSTGLLKDVHTEIRNIAFNLMPQTLMKAGLVAAVEELIHRINNTGQVEVHLSVYDLEKRLNEVVEVSLYRIIQEFLSNTMKHSNATHIYIGLTNHEDELVLTIEDDGAGYNLDLFKNSKSGNGWRNISTRLNLIHASIEIDTLVGRKGTSVLISIPAEKLHLQRIPA